MRFLDANVIIHALAEEKRELPPKTKEMKENAKKILERLIEGKEEVYITTIQISEILNILEDLADNINHIEINIEILTFLIENPMIKVVEVTLQDMQEAQTIMKKYKENRLGFNDAIAYISMKKTKSTEIYTFDKHFKILPGIKPINS